MRTSRHWIAIALVAVLAGLVAAPSSAPAAGKKPSYVVVTKGFSVARIGRFRPTRDASLAAAIRAFGRPSVRKADRNLCRVEWRRVRLRIDFVNLGGLRPGEGICDARGGSAQRFTARGSRFRTTKGLRPGARSSTIPKRHPRAEYDSRGFWALVTAVFPFGDEEPAPVLSALTRRGRVSALTGYIGAAGE